MFEIQPTTAAQIDDLNYHIYQKIGEALETAPSVQEGTIVGNSYNPAEGTAEMLFGDTYCILGDDGIGGDAYINHQHLPLLTMMPGDLYGPTGLERAIAIPTTTGYGIFYRHGPDDVPMVPPGERWIMHRPVAFQGLPGPFNYDSALLLTNDGPTPGDGLAGAHLGHQGSYTTLDTNSGHQVALNDTAQTVLLQTAAGHSTVYNDPHSTITTTTIGGMTDVFSDLKQTITRSPGVAAIFEQLDGNKQTITQAVSDVITQELDAVKQTITQTVLDGVFAKLDAQAQKISFQTLAPSGTNNGVMLLIDSLSQGGNGAISHIVNPGGLIGLGTSAVAGLPGGSGAINNSILSTFGGNINSANLQTLINLANAMVTAGIPNASALIPLIVSSLIQNVSVPNGSSVVKIGS